MKEIHGVKTLIRDTYVKDNPTFLIDLDETLWGMAASYIQYINERTGTNHSVADVTVYDICAALNVPRDFFEEVLFSDAFSKPTLFPHSVEFINNIRGRKFNHMFGIDDDITPNVALVSLRGFRPDGMIITNELVNNYGIHFDVMSMLPLSMSKLHYADECFSDVVCLVDDSPNNLVEFYNGGYMAVRAKAPWNEKGVHPSIPNFVDLRVSPLFNPIV